MEIDDGPPSSASKRKRKQQEPLPPDFEEHLDLLTDRLAMRQALSGLGDVLGDLTSGTQEAELDDVQSFWRAVIETQ